jgi:hypothetical protein
MVSENLHARDGDIFTSINMGHAVMWLMDAWNRVTEDTIKNCWSHAGFTRSIDPPPTPSSELLVETDSLAVLLEQQYFCEWIPLRRRVDACSGRRKRRVGR